MPSRLDRLARPQVLFGHPHLDPPALVVEAVVGLLDGVPEQARAVEGTYCFRLIAPVAEQVYTQAWGWFHEFCPHPWISTRIKNQTDLGAWLHGLEPGCTRAVKLRALPFGTYM